MDAVGQKEEQDEDLKAGFWGLKEYVDNSGDIIITSQSLAVPEERREGFYRLVENAQKGIARHVLGDLADKGERLAERCARRQEQLIEGTDLKGFHLPRTLESFMADPMLTMAKPAFGIILEGLQKELSFKEMEEQAARQVVPFCKDLLRAAYEAWLYYGVVKALRPVRYYGIWSPDTVELQVMETDTVNVGSQVTSPERRMPETDFVTEDDQVFARKSEVAEELDFYGVRPARCCDFSSGGNTVDQIAHRVLLIYRLRAVDQVPLLADRERLYVLPSDLMCEFLLPEEMEHPRAVAQFVSRIKTVRSRRPVQVLTADARGELPAGLMEDPMMPPIERRAIGGDEQKLEAVARRLEKEQKGR